MVHIYPVLEDTKLLKALNNLMDIKGDLISITNLPSFITLPEDMFSQLLDDNEIKGERRNKSYKYYYALNNLVKNKPLKSIYSQEEIKKACSTNNFVYKNLSIIAEKNIFASNEFLRKHFNYLLEKTKKENNYKIGLINTTISHNLFINSEGYAFTWNPDLISSVVITTEPNIVASFFKKVNQEWENIPKIKRFYNICWGGK